MIDPKHQAAIDAITAALVDLTEIDDPRAQNLAARIRYHLAVLEEALNGKDD